jgi:diacylglycerol kinase family enzyme
VPTTGPATAGSIARRSIQAGADLILAAGGDGTLNEVIDGMANSTVPVGVLPAGTANVLATEARLGSSMEQAARNLLNCVPRRISLGRLHCDGRARYFLLMAGVGLDAHIVYNISVALKARWGKFAYWAGGFSLAGRSLPEFIVQIGGKKHLCSFALVSKVRNYGGDFEIARDTSLLDDHFEVVLFEGRNSLRYLKYFLGVATNRLRGMSGVSVFRAREVRIPAASGRSVYIQVDGEYAGHLPAKIEIVPGALTLLIPPEYEKRGKGGGSEEIAAPSHTPAPP